ncbi:ArsR family transcriptional regulator [Streptomyces sp. NPDC007903]|uniref:ArsR family transcriptional regulator n=1 Tax=Streptomyces sp. NPDC007903 TaxID=3364786 RepID=UPI0036DFFBBE
MWVLAEGEHDVSQLQDRVGRALPTVSQHLTQLRLAGPLRLSGWARRRMQRDRASCPEDRRRRSTQTSRSPTKCQQVIRSRSSRRRPSTPWPWCWAVVGTGLLGHAARFRRPRDAAPGTLPGGPDVHADGRQDTRPGQRQSEG